MPEFKNSFEGGRNFDADPSIIPNNQYISATDVELVGEGNFYRLRNIKGGTVVQQLSTNTNYKILHELPTKYLIDGELVNCITIFSAGTGLPFKIQAYDVENDDLYDLYQETVASDYHAGRVMQAVNNPENGVDHIYFTDFYHEIRHFRCEIPDSYSANFLNSYELSLLRRGSNGTITATIGSSGGTLLSGSYQFSYRMCDPTGKTFTKWSSLTNPIHVYSATNSTSPVYSGIGLVTSRKISLTITPSAEETTHYDHIQLAVIENIGPTDAISASVLEIESIPSTSLSYDYKSNSKIGTIPLEDIVVDLAQIDKVKTLAVKDNRLIAGNVHYKNLEMDNGVPAITSGTIITQADTSVDSFSNDEFASKYRGHWRGEVYRYGVVYRDEFGNASPVQPLDLSGVTDNAISGSLTDLKFPDRSNPDYTLFNSSGRIQSLGVRLTGLNNHPSWARSLEIVRVNRVGRLKNILFQSPIIPMTQVYGMGAFDTYPNTYVSSISGSTLNTTTDENLTPQTSGYTLIPKNLFWPEMRGLTFDTNNITFTHIGETSGHQFSMIFPPDSMYSTNPFVHTGAEKLDFVDYALLKVNTVAKHPDKSPSVVAGDDINTNISGTFYALTDGQYYFNSGHGKGGLLLTNKPIVDLKNFSNLGTTDSIGGSSIMDHESMKTGGLDWGYKPNIQKCAVIKLGGTIVPDIVASGAAFSAGTLNAYNAGGFIIGSSGIKYETTKTNKYVNHYSGSPNTYVQAISIANVKLGLGDDRYGEATDLHEYISTGCKYTFSAAEVATLEGGGDVVLPDLDVWGGDCFTGPRLFKVCDSTYSIVGQSEGSPTNTQYLSKWKFFYKPTGGVILNQPIAIENAAQYVQVVLESDYAEVMENDVVVSTSNESGIPIYNNDTKESMRIPLTYRYNSNLSKQNYQRVYVTKPTFSFEQSEFNSRLIYSDLKIYNSSEAGFDIFRVANFYDLEEKFRPITKLAVAGDNLYSIHEQGVIYIPTGENQVEQADGGTLAVRSGDVIGKPIVIDNERGSQHPRGIVETGGVIYIPDNRNKNVYILSGQQLKPITKDNESIFRAMFATMKDEVVGIYHPERREYWVYDGTDCQVYNEALGVWVSEYNVALKGGAATHQNLYVTDKVGTDTSIYKWYTGTPREATVKFSVNPDPTSTKTFDNTCFSASQRLSSMNFEVERESSLGSQTATKNLEIESHKGNWRVDNPRDSAIARLRGMYCLVTMTWDTTQSVLREVWTKLRYTARRRF